MGELIRNRDWRQSELGAPAQWPETLKSAISSVLSSGTAMHISWGANLLQFYNDAYAPVLTDGKHPAALGRSVRESYPEIWDFIWPLFERVLGTGEAIAMENAGLMMYRDGVLKESFFSFSYSPLKSLAGEVCGVTAVCWETTEEVIVRRRERGLRLLNEQLAAAMSLEEVRHAVRGHVDGNRADLPFLLWYERDEALKTLRLVESCGISAEAPLILELAALPVLANPGAAPGSRQPAGSLLSLAEPATGWLLDAPPAMVVERVAIEPLCYVNYSTPDAYLVFGIGAQRPFDGSCQSFHENTCRGVERAVRRISAVEFERREGLRQFDTVMRVTLDAANIGYWDLDLATYTPKRSLLHDRIFGYDEAVADWSYAKFLEHVLEQDREDVDRAFQAGLEAKAGWDIECRIIRRDGALRWIWVHGEVLTNAAGQAVRTLGIIIDITDRKGLEAAMRESEQRIAGVEKHSVELADRLAVTLNSFTDGLYTVDPDWRFTFLNNEAERLLERPREALLGGDLWAEFPALLGSGFEREYRRAMKDNVTVTVVEYFEPLKGWFSVRAFPSEQGLAVYLRNVTESRQAAEALRASEEEFRTLAEAMPQIVWITRPDGWNTYINQQWSDYTGLTLEESLGHRWSQPFHADDRERSMQAWQEARDGVGTYSIESRLRRADGEYRWWLIRAVPMLDAAGQVSRWFGTCTDIHDLKMAELEINRVNQDLRESEIRVKRLNRVYAVLSQINAVIVGKPGRDELLREACRVAAELAEFSFAWIGLLDPDAGVLTPVASAGEVADILALASREVFDCQPGATGRAARALRERTAQVMNNFARGGQRLMREAMEARGIHSFAVLPLVVQGEAIGVFALYAREAGFFDAEEMRLLEELAGNISLAIENIEKRERLDYLAYYDPLTGLANRALFLDRMTQQMRSATGGGHQMVLFLIDLERFKNVNDSLGRPAGDALLRQVADWMARRGGDASLLARVGSNHFAALVPQVRAGGDLAQLIERAITALESHPFAVEGAILRVTAKVGAALFPEAGSSAETLFQNAEAALKQAKANGDRYLFHSSAMTADVAGKLDLENQLRRALDNQEFVLHYQPKVNVKSGKVTGAEALIRWNDPRTGLVPPGQFIPVLEETGLIHEVGRWAMRQAIADYLRWVDAGLAGVRIAVNVSSLQLRSRGFVAEVAQALAIDPRAASGLELEITESMIMGDIDHGIASLQAIRALGATVALDDFGTGFSSLSYLARLPIDILKIDRAFINAMAGTPEGLALVSTIISLGHSLGHKVVAEGVETEAQSRLLRLLDCDDMQGFHFGRPVPSAAFEADYLGPSKN